MGTNEKGLTYYNSRDLNDLPFELDASLYHTVSDFILKFRVDYEQTKSQRTALDDLLRSLENVLKNAEENLEPVCLALVIEIDNQIDYQLLKMDSRYDIFSEYPALNRQFCDKIRILPVLADTAMERGDLKYQEVTQDGYSLLRSKQKIGAPPKIRDFVCNYLIFDEKMIERFDFTIYDISRYSILGRRLKDKNEIKIGIMPLIYEDVEKMLQIRYEKSEMPNCSMFEIEGVKEAYHNKISGRYLQAVRRYQREDVDFVVFPEMLITDDMIQQLKNEQADHAWNAILFNGSIWNQRKNRCVISDGMGNTICTYYKKIPYIHKAHADHHNYREKLEENNRYCLIDIDGFGRIGVCICKDLYDYKQMLFPKEVLADLFFIPSFTNSMDMQENARNLAASNNIFLVLGNTCTSFWEEKKKDAYRFEKNKIGYIVVPGKNGENGREAVLEFYMTSDHCAECETECTGKVLYINFGNTIGDKTVTYEYNLY